jgi:hypothetical protein
MSSLLRAVWADIDSRLCLNSELIVGGYFLQSETRTDVMMCEGNDLGAFLRPFLLYTYSEIGGTRKRMAGVGLRRACRTHVNSGVVALNRATIHL